MSRSQSVDTAIALLMEVIAAPHRIDLVANELRQVLPQIADQALRADLNRYLDDLFLTGGNSRELARVEEDLTRWMDTKFPVG